MSYEWLGKPKATLSAPFLAALALAAVACGAAAPATPAPTAPPAEPPPAAMAEPAPEPTAVPAPMQEPPDDMVAGPKQAPVFDEYWTPDTDFYGEPVYGGTLRINYEDPLEHANTWGASTGAATRYRGATMNRIVSDNPYDNTEIIPDLAKGWTRALPAPPSTSMTTSPGITVNPSSARMLASPSRPGSPGTASPPVRTRPTSASLTWTIPAA